MYKLIKPTTSGRRSLVVADRSKLYKGKPLKALVTPLSGSGGRNNDGKVTVRHRGGGHKRAYRLVAVKRLIVRSEVVRLEHDPNRSCCVALTRSSEGLWCYVLGTEGVVVGDWIEASELEIECKLGNALKLKYISVGVKIHNVELRPGAGGAVCRSAGAFCQIHSKAARSVVLKLRSGVLRVFSSECMATVGVVSDRQAASEKLGKAGRARWLGRRPSVRGVAMNPVDHPHGGGEGKTSGGRHPVTPWGKPTKGKKTRRNRRTDSLIVKLKRLR
ncbi:50S ribosomal protein L2 [Candidatus Hodgkinia cicadicola]